MASYVHHIPGRLRVKSRKFKNGFFPEEKLHDHLNSVEGVTSFSINKKLGSVTVHYDTNEVTGEDILHGFQQAGGLGLAKQSNGVNGKNGSSGKTAIPAVNKAGEVLGRAVFRAFARQTIESSVFGVVSAVFKRRL